MGEPRSIPACVEVWRVTPVTESMRYIDNMPEDLEIAVRSTRLGERYLYKTERSPSTFPIEATGSWAGLATALMISALGGLIVHVFSIDWPIVHPRALPSLLIVTRKLPLAAVDRSSSKANRGMPLESTTTAVLPR